MTYRPRERLPAAVLAWALLLPWPGGLRASPRDAVPLATSIDCRGWEEGLAAALFERLSDALGSDYGGWVSLELGGSSPTRLDVSVTGSLDALTARCVLTTPEGAKRASTSHASGLALLVPVLAGDILSLWAGEEPAEAFGGPSPVLVATVSTASLAGLGFPPEEVTDIAYGPEGLVLATAGGAVALDGLLRVTPQTARDLSASRRSPLAVPVARLQTPRTGARIMLAADQSTLVFSDPSRGESSRFCPAGGPFAGLTAMPWGGFALWRSLSSSGGPAAEVMVGYRRGQGFTETRFTVSPALVSAAASDYDGNIWLYDAVERRIRVFDRAGWETFAIKPLLGRAAIKLPQQIAVYPDGSFLIAGEGEIWRLDRSGVPIWRLLGLDATGRHALPRSFRIALHGVSGSFSILDPEAREIHLFADSAATGTEAELVRLRATASREELASWCLDKDLAVIAAETLGTADPGEPSGRARLRKRLTRVLAEDLARATAEHAGGLQAALDYRAAEPVLAEAVERYRALRASYPTESSYGAAIEALSRRRQQVRETLFGFLEAGVNVRATVLHPAAGASLSLTLAPASDGVAPIPGRQQAEAPREAEGVVAEVSSGGRVRPATIALGDLTAEREVTIPLELDPDAALLEEDTPVEVGLLLSGTVGREVLTRFQSVPATLSSRLRFDETWSALASPGSPRLSRAAFLAWLVAADDPCVARFRRAILPQTGPSIEAAAQVFSLLSDVFRPPAPAANGEVQAPRQTLHALAGSEEDALLLAAALLPGIARAFLTLDAATYLLIDTGLPLAAGAAAPLDALAALAGRETLLLPLSFGGREAREAGAAPLESAARRALEELSTSRLERARLAWVEEAGAPVRSPYLPAYAIPRPRLIERASADAAATRALIER